MTDLRPYYGQSRYDLQFNQLWGIAHNEDGSLKAFLRPEDFGAAGDGATDDSAALLAAINSADGAPVLLTQDYYVEQGILVQGPLYLFGPGRIVYPAELPIANHIDGNYVTASGVNVQPLLESAIAVSSTSTATWPATTGSLVSSITFSSTPDLSVGDFCLIHSSDTYGYNTGCKRGELFRILDVSGSTVYCNRVLIETYSTSPVVQKLSTDRVVIDGPTFVAAGDIWDDSVTSRGEALSIWGAVRPEVRCNVDGGWSKGVTFYSCFQPYAEVSVKDIRDNVTINAYGYGVVAAGATFGGRFNVLAEHVRHAFTTNAGFAAGPAQLVGVPQFGTVSGQAMNTSSASFDTHEALWFRFINCFATFESPDPYNGSVSGQVWSFQDRGFNTRFHNCHAIGTGNGFVDSTTGYDYATAYPGQPHDIVLNNCSVESLTTDGSINSGTTGFGHTIGDAGYAKPHIYLDNFRTFNVNEPIAFSSSFTYYITGGWQKNGFKHRLASFNTVEMDSVTLENAISSLSMENFTVTSTMTVKARNIRVIGSLGNNAALFHASGGGTVSLDAWNIRFSNAGSAYAAVDTDGSTSISGNTWDGLRRSDSSSDPTSGTYLAGQRVYDPAPSPGGYIGRICTTSGQAASAWATSHSYALNDTVANGSRIYQCTTAGTSASSGGPTGTGSSISDGSAIWKYVNPQVVFKTFGAISS